VLAADDDVGEPEVLAIDAVHDRLLRTAIEHLDVQAEQQGHIIDVVTLRFPQLLIFVALAKLAVFEQRPVGPHPGHGVDVVRLGLADQRVQDHARVVSLAGQGFCPVHQGVFMGPVERIAGLESHHALPALLGKQRPCFSGGQNELTVFRVLRLRQDFDPAPNQHLAGVVHDHLATWVIGPFCLIDRLDIGGFVPREDVFDLERPDRLAGGVRQPHSLAELESGGEILGHRQRDRNGPRILPPVMVDVDVAENLVVDRFDHWTGQRAQATVTNPVNAGQIGVADRQRPQRGNFL